jgi:hypothetical protein
MRGGEDQSGEPEREYECLEAQLGNQAGIAFQPRVLLQPLPRFEEAELGSGGFAGELPLDARLLTVGAGVPGMDFRLQDLEFGIPSGSEALPGHQAEFNSA